MSFLRSVVTGFAFALGAFPVMPAIALVVRLLGSAWC
jgi:hypothetical protein